VHARGVLDRGRLVMQEELATLQAPTGRTVLRTPDVKRAHALLDGRIEQVDGERLVVVVADAAELNARLVAAGVRVRELGPERRSLEQIVLDATHPGLGTADS